MPEPTYSETTEIMYDRLPEIYRTEDEKIDWPLKNWISVTGDQVGEIEAMYDGFDIDTPEDGGDPDEMSTLVDPATAEAEWLPWIAQLLGKTLTPLMTEAQQREYLQNANYSDGTKAALANATKTVLTGDQYVQIFDHTNDGDDIGGGGPFDVLIVTKTSETTTDPIAVIIAAGVKPAGIVLYHSTFETPWDVLEAAYGPWNGGWEQPWNTIEAEGL